MNIKYTCIISGCRDLYSSGIVDYCLICVLPLIYIANSIKVGIYQDVQYERLYKTDLNIHSLAWKYKNYIMLNTLFVISQGMDVLIVFT